jgi:general secretion pathway protein F
MPVFKYRGYNEAGAEVSGAIDAENLREAIVKIKERGIFPGKVSEEAAYRRGVLSRRSLTSLLPEVTRRLSTLLSSGVPLIDALNALSSEQKGVWRNILVDIKERVSGGASLSRAMQSYPDVFPDFYTGMVSAGESSGELSSVLNTLSDFLETQMNTRGKIRTALIYPVFMVIVSAIVLSFLFIFVVPKITRIFEDSAQGLPAITILLIYISNAFRRYWWLMALLLIAFAGIYRLIRERRKDLIDRILLKDPTGIMMTLYMLRFTTTMSLLLHGGVPMLNALRLTSKATGNLIMERRIMSAYELVSQGARLSSSLEGFPPTVLQVISKGERSGRLPEVLSRLALSYEREFDRRLQKAIGLLEPSLILVMGFIVGFIVLAVLLPIFELNQLIR